MTAFFMITCGSVVVVVVFFFFFFFFFLVCILLSLFFFLAESWTMILQILIEGPGPGTLVVAFLRRY